VNQGEDMASWKRQAFESEHDRCESIIFSRAAGIDFGLAKKLAFDTALSADAAIELLYSSNQPIKSHVDYMQLEEVDRIEAIINESGSVNMSLAKHVALNTSMPVKEAIAFVKSSHADSQRGLLSEAMSHVQNPDVWADAGCDDDAGSDQAMQTAVALVNKRKVKV